MKKKSLIEKMKSLQHQYNIDLEEIYQIVAAAKKHAHDTFVWPLNKQKEPMRIPSGQSVPNGYAKHCKIAEKHFIHGAIWYKINKP